MPPAIAILVLLIWLACLIGMVVTSANPVVVNQRQVRLSDGILAIEVVDQAAGRCTVTTEWGDLGLSGEQTIDGLASLPPLQKSVRYLVPVTVAGETLSVTGTHPDRPGPTLIYPDTPAAREQIEALLK